MRQAVIFILLLLAGAALVGCSSAVRSPQMQATVDAISTAAVATISERMLGNPAATPVPDGNEAPLAAAPEATLALPDLTATSEAPSAAFEPFLAELPDYQLAPDQGQPAWQHPPLTLAAQGPQGANFANQFAATVAADFLLAADVSWRTQGEQTGCGFVLRSDGDQSAPSQYLLGLSRFGGGRVVFSVVSQGEVISEQESSPARADASFSAADGAANRLAVVAQGSRFRVYTNGVLVAEFDPNQPPERPVLPPPPPKPADSSDPLVLSAYLAVKKEYDQRTNQILSGYNARLRAFQAAERDFGRGFVAMGALAQQGSISCTFGNAWLWHITQ